MQCPALLGEQTVVCNHMILWHPYTTRVWYRAVCSTVQLQHSCKHGCCINQAAATTVVMTLMWTMSVVVPSMWLLSVLHTPLDHTRSASRGCRAAPQADATAVCNTAGPCGTVLTFQGSTQQSRGWLVCGPMQLQHSCTAHMYSCCAVLSSVHAFIWDPATTQATQIMLAFAELAALTPTTTMAFAKHRCKAGWAWLRWHTLQQPSGCHSSRLENCGGRPTPASSAMMIHGPFM
jgi:hypothetical protein